MSINNTQHNGSPKAQASKPRIYATSDLWRAAYLRLLGWKIADLRENGQRTTISLEVPEGIDPESVVNEYRNRIAKVEPMAYVAEYKGLKNEFEQLRVNVRRADSESSAAGAS